jgi:monoamine oxidase
MTEVGVADKVVALPTGFNAAVRSGGRWKHVDYGSLLGPVLTGALSTKDKLSILVAALPALAAMRAAARDYGDLVSLERLDTRAASAGLTDRAATYFTAGPHEFLWGTPTAQISYAMLAMQLHVFKGELREVAGGAGTFVAGVAEGLDVRHNSAVERIEHTGSGVVVHVDEQSVRANAVILACPADVSARLWPDAPASVRAHLTSVQYSRIDYLYLRTSKRLTLSAGGRTVGMEVIPTPEVSGAIGGIYVANGWARSGGLWLVTAAPAARAGEIGDEELTDLLQADTEKLHPELTGAVTERRLIRHYPYTPTFGPGSIKRLAVARMALPAARVDLAGDHMAAPWVEGAVRAGQQAADRVRILLSRR